MIKIFKSFLVLGFMFVLSNNLVLADELADVKKTFYAFSQSLINRDGMVLGEHVSASSIAAVEKCRKLALTPGKIDTTNLMQSEVNAIMVMRYILSKEQLSKMTAKYTLVAGINSGVIQKKLIKSLTMGPCTIDGNTARAAVTRNVIFKGGVILRKEHGIWKVEIVKTLRLLERQFKIFRQKTGKSKIDIALDFLKENYNTQIPQKILIEPLK